MKRLLLAAATFAVVPTLALAQGTAPSFPNYDVAEFCNSPVNQRVARMGGGSLCYQMHYQNRKAVSKIWSETPPAVRAECAGAADQWRDYGILLVCIGSHLKDD
jgi:hypothetical protein